MEKKIEDYLHLYLGCECDIDEGEFPATTLPLCGVTESRAIIGRHALKLVELKDVRLKLRPLSSMTEDEKIKWSEETEPEIKKQSDAYKLRWFWIQFANDGKYTPEQFTWLLSKHFDLFNLIEAGLAIDKTTLIH